jgi:hypothetical protein
VPPTHVAEWAGHSVEVFAGRLLDWAQTLLRTTLHLVRKPAGQRGFAVIPGATLGTWISVLPRLRQ